MRLSVAILKKRVHRRLLQYEHHQENYSNSLLHDIPRKWFVTKKECSTWDYIARFFNEMVRHPISCAITITQPRTSKAVLGDNIALLLERQKSNQYIVKKLTVKKAEFGNSK